MTSERNPLRQLTRRIDKLLEKAAQSRFENWFAHHWIAAAVLVAAFAFALFAVGASLISGVVAGVSAFLVMAFRGWRDRSQT